MKRYENSRILVFGDTHYPFEHKDSFDFLKELKKEFNPDRVIHMGDELDQYATSQYPKDPTMDVFARELKAGKKKLAKLHDLFPKMTFLSSNHGDRVYKRAKAAGIPREVLKPYKELLGAKDWDWQWVNDLTLTVDKTREHIYFVHTKTGTALTIAQRLGMHVVVGHHHTKMGVNYFTTPRRVVWGVDAGCMVSDKGAPYEYSKGNIIRPTRGATIIIEGVPQVIPM